MGPNAALRGVFAFLFGLGRFIQYLDPGVADLNVNVAAAEFLKADVPLARSVLDGRTRLPVMPQHNLVLLVQVQIVNNHPVEGDVQMRPLESYHVAVPLCGLIDLFERRDGPVDAAGQFRILGAGIVAVIGHLQLHPVERRIAGQRSPQGAAAVARWPELEIELQNEVAVLALADQPGAPGGAAVQNAVLHGPFNRRLDGLAHIAPASHQPAFRRAVLRKEPNESLFFCFALGNHDCRCQ